MHVLGISAFYHDAAAALIRDGEIVNAVQEERFTRIKHDPSLPRQAMAWCLADAGVGPGDLDAVVYYDKPLDTFNRIVRTFVRAGVSGVRTWPEAMTEWMRRKLWVPYEIERGLRDLGHPMPGRLLYAEHHQSHAAAAFHPSPFESACVLTFDGVGEWATTSIGHGRDGRVELREEIRFPHSLGLLYSAFTVAAGFKVNSGEYKLMGLAPYGEPRFRDVILDEVVHVASDGSFTLDLRYFDFLGGRRMTSDLFDRTFGAPRRPEDPITARECDLARSVQVVLEEIVLAIAARGRELTGERHAVLAGGVALNCVANARLRADGPFDDVWVQPAAGDAGSAAGCALWAWHEVLGGGPTRRDGQGGDGMSGALLGPEHDADELARLVDAEGWPHRRMRDPGERARAVAEALADGQVVAVVQGPMEFGPRALGNRSILADPRSRGMQRDLNLKIKQRESFRPFAPAVLADRADEWFELPGPSPYMTFVVPVVGASMAPEDPEASADDLHAKLDRVRSPIPAVTHVDGSARVQTVTAERAPGLHAILTAFDELTGCPVLVNTSFNVRGEPIVHTPEDAYRCFMTTDIDLLVLEDCLLRKVDQPPWTAPAPRFEPD